MCSHQIRNAVVKEILLSELQRITAFAREHEDEFLQMVTKKSLTKLNKSQREGKGELEQAMQNISKLDKIIQRLFVDNTEGKISDERFVKMSTNYEAEQEQLDARIKELKHLPSGEKEESLNTSYFLYLAKRYTMFENWILRSSLNSWRRFTFTKLSMWMGTKSSASKYPELHWGVQYPGK